MHVLVAVQVNSKGRAVRRVVDEYAAHVRCMIAVARGVGWHLVVEKPLAEQAVARRGVESCHAGHHAQDWAVVEARGDLLVWMRIRQGIGSSPLVGQIALDLVLVAPRYLGFEDHDLGNVALEVVCCRGILATNLYVEDGGVVLKVSLHPWLVGILHVAQDVELGAADDSSAGAGSVLLLQSLGYEEDGCS